VFLGVRSFVGSSRAGRCLKGLSVINGLGMLGLSVHGMSVIVLPCVVPDVCHYHVAVEIAGANLARGMR